MAYDHYQASFQTAVAQALTSSGVVAASRWHIGYQGVRVRAVALAVTTAFNAAGAVTIRHRPTPGSATGQEVIAVINVPDAVAAGDVVYVDGLDYHVPPGGEIVADVTDATPTAGNATISYFYQPSWEHPSNFENMIDGA